jgi:hypothetical protein
MLSLPLYCERLPRHTCLTRGRDERRSKRNCPRRSPGISGNPEGTHLSFRWCVRRTHPRTTYIDLVGQARSRRYILVEAGAITNPLVTKRPNIVALFVTCPRFGRRAVSHRVRPFFRRPIADVFKVTNLIYGRIHPGAADCKRFSRFVYSTPSLERSSTCDSSVSVDEQALHFTPRCLPARCGSCRSG